MAETSDLHVGGTPQYPAGHLGHLSPTQTTAFETFKTLLQNHSLYQPATDSEDASHDDTTLLRFLRARRFDPPQALTQFRDNQEWRRANRLAEFYESIDIHEYEQTRVLYPHWTGRRDRRGMPVFLFEIASLDSKTMASYTQSTTTKESKTREEEKQKAKKSREVNGADTASTTTQSSQSTLPVKLLRLFALHENTNKFVFPLCTAVPSRPFPETPISQTNNIVDISGVGLWQFWNLKAHMQDASVLAQAHYPETLDRIFIVGAPSFFPTVWGWVKRWFDPVTVAKIFVLSKENVTATLEQFIDRQNIPTQYGGELEFKWRDLPNLDPEIEKMINWGGQENGTEESKGKKRGIPSGPMLLRPNEDGKGATVVAVGSENGEQRRLEIGSISSAPSSTSANANAAAAASEADNVDHSQTLSVDGTAAPAIATPGS